MHNSLKEKGIYKTRAAWERTLNRVSGLKSESGKRGSFLFPIAVAILAQFSFFPTQAKVKQGANVQINRVGGATHLELLGLSQWNYQIDHTSLRKNGKISLMVDEITPESLQKLKDWRGPLIKEIEIDTDSTDGKTKVVFLLADKSVDTFDYLTDKPSRLIVDFFKLPENKSNENIKKKKLVRKLPKKKNYKKITKNKTKKESLNKRKSYRLPAGTDSILILDNGNNEPLATVYNKGKPQNFGVFDGGDPLFARFSILEKDIKEDSIIRSRGNIYLLFPMLKIKSEYLQVLEEAQPIYEIRPKDNVENKQARLLVKLFERERPAVFFKTLKIFREKFPKSRYDEILRFAQADIYYRLWKKRDKNKYYEMAMTHYRKALVEFPESPLKERTLLLMGFSSLVKGNSFETLQVFEKFLREEPKSRYRNKVKLAVAEAYLNLNKYKSSFSLLQGFEKGNSDIGSQIEAFYRKGDVFVTQRKYDQAIKSYQAAFKKYPESWQQFPNAFYNQAESLFWQGRYLESLDSYRSFVVRFPLHEHAAYAMTRMGELLEILGADETKVTGAYLETYFRYGNTKSSSVARIRLIGQKFASMKESDLEKNLGEMQKIVKESSLPKIKEFVKIVEADGFAKRKNFSRAVLILEKYYRENPVEANLPVIQNRVVRYINEEVKRKVIQKNFIGALKEYDKYQSTWLKKSNRLDTHYYVARSYELAGAYKESAKVYRKVLNSLYTMGEAGKGKERNVFEELPSTDLVNLRLAAVSSKGSDYRKAFEYLKQIRNPKKLSANQRIESVDIAAQVAEQRGNIRMAQKFFADLLRTWEGKPELVVRPALRLAKLYKKTNQKKKSLKYLDYILDIEKDSSLVKPDLIARSLELYGDISLDIGERGKAIKAYERLLSEYGSKAPMASTRYRLGEIFFQNGKLQKASSVWSDLDKTKNKVWYDLAQEKMRTEKWKNDYKKYLKRIPAMADGN